MKNKVLSQLEAKGNATFAEHHLRFFKTGKGEYGEGDLFLGLRVPDVRSIANANWKDISMEDLLELLHNSYHEVRQCALFMLVKKFEKADEKQQSEIVKLYVKNAKYVNNWDLVDASAPRILGAYYVDRSLDDLWKLAKSKDLWKERMAMVSMWYFSRKGNTLPIYELAEYFLIHKHDLMHKASGWMLREAGKKDRQGLINFLNIHAAIMPRTMLRYSIEHLPKEEREFFMKMKDYK